MDRRTFVSLASAAAFGGANLRAARAAATPLDTALPAPVWTKTYGNLRVNRYGNQGPPLIFVPGLACGEWSWNGTIAHELAGHTIYSVVEGGFAGLPPAQPMTLEGIVSSLVALIAGESIAKPVLIGHSLGGTTVLKFGIEHPGVARGLVSVDGTPVNARYASASDERRIAGAKTVADMLRAQSPDAYLAFQAKTVRDFVTDPATAAQVAKLTAGSDQSAVANYVQDLYGTDLRPKMSLLTDPAILIAPVPALPLPSYMPAVLAGLDADARKSAILQFYEDQLQFAAHAKVVPVLDSRHFVMLDQPAAFYAALDAFLSANS